MTWKIKNDLHVLRIQQNNIQRIYDERFLFLLYRTIITFDAIVIVIKPF